MYANVIKTAILMFALSLILLAMGNAIGGQDGLFIAFIIAVIMNFVSYFFSDKIVLNMYGAKPMNPHDYPALHENIVDLSGKIGIPMPKVWIVSSPTANAFATGRNPRNASIAFTTGILQLLDEDELRGVTAHELSHIKNRDILIGTIAATLATAITYLASMARYAAFWGTHSNDRDRSKSSGPIVLILISFIAPLAATLVQLGISRSREFQADETGAHTTHEPLALASALEKIEQHGRSTARQQSNDIRYAPANELGIAKSFSAGGLMALFSTHPTTAERIKRLGELERTLRQR